MCINAITNFTHSSAACIDEHLLGPCNVTSPATTISLFHLSETEPHQEICDTHQDCDEQNDRCDDLSGGLWQVPPGEGVADAPHALGTRLFDAREPVDAIASQVPAQIAM